MRLFIPLLLLSLAAHAQKFRADDPLDAELKPVPVAEPASRKLSDYYDAIWNTLATPGDLNTQHPAKPTPAQGVNTLGEPMQGSWWVKRHYYQSMSVAELVAGPGSSNPPSASGPWTVVGAKNEGVTPGFVILDGKKELYFIKFDPMTNPEMASAADHVSIRLVHALGYHVPENYIVDLTEDMLVLGEDVTLADRLGRRRKMSRRDISDMLRKAPQHDGKYRATASRAIAGKGIGPYRYHGTRSDDPNDFVSHEHRRDLRGLAVVSAWIDHDDSRAINTYDAVVDSPGGKFVRHYILDLGSTLGSGTQKPNSPRSGGEYLFDWGESAKQLGTVGLAVPGWARADFPDLPAVGKFESARFNPETWVPEYPNPAFLNRLPDDEFWAAKQIMAFRDDEIRAIVKSARYSDPKAEEWIIKCLIERRDKIGRAYFGKVLPIDRFAVRGGQLAFDDLSEKAGFGASGPYTIQWLQLDNASGSATPIANANTAAVPGQGGAYRVARITNAKRANQSVDVTVRFDGNTPSITGVDRQWQTKGAKP